MSTAFSRSEQIFPVSKRKALLLLVGCLGFVLLAVMIAAQHPLIGWLGAVFFGLGIPVALLMLWPGRFYLRLDERGFELVSPFSRQFTAWRDVQGFYLCAIHGTRMIAVVYRDEHAMQTALRRFSVRLSGVETAIPGSYQAPLEEVLAALNDWHGRYVAD